MYPRSTSGEPSHLVNAEMVLLPKDRLPTFVTLVFFPVNKKVSNYHMPLINCKREMLELHNSVRNLAQAK